MSWKFDSKRPLVQQISDKLRLDVLAGRYPPGSPFPPVRQLAFEASVNPNTMQKALTVLEEEGLLEGRGTAGRLVTTDTAVMDTLGQRLRREYIHRVLAEAQSLGITRGELLQLLTESEE